MISIGLTPNFSKAEVRESIGMVFKSSNGSGKKLTNVLEEYFKKEVILVESGRVGLCLLLKAIGLKEGDEVMVQGFTCSVVPGSVMAAGGKPVFVDIDASLNMEIIDLKKKINKKTKAVVVQHTFGSPAKIEEIKSICRENKVLLVEDLAHGLGNSVGGKKLGCWGDVAFLSFGRDKVISGVWGGAVVSGNNEIMEKLGEVGEKLPTRGRWWVKKQLIYVWWMDLVKRGYEYGWGKWLHWGLRRLGWVDDAITGEEKRGGMGPMYRGMQDELAQLTLGQWQRLGKTIETRKSIAKLYAKELGGAYDADCSYLRYSILIKNAATVRNEAAKENIFLGDWYDQVVAPKSVNPKTFGYVAGSCPRAEEICEEIINLPTYVGLKDGEIERIIELVKKYGNKGN